MSGPSCTTADRGCSSQRCQVCGGTTESAVDHVPLLQNTQSEMLLLNQLDIPCSSLEIFSFPPTTPGAPGFFVTNQQKGVASRLDTSASFLSLWTIFQNKGVLKLLIIIPGRSVELRRLGGDSSGCHDGGELRHTGVSGVDADCDATAAGKTAA